MTCKVSGDGTQQRRAGPTGTVTFTDLQTNGVLGTATLGSPAQTRSLLGYVNYTTGAGPVAVVYGDFNGDGVLDLAVPSQPDNTLSILLGNPDGTFQAQRTYTVSSYPLGGAVGDHNKRWQNSTWPSPTTRDGQHGHNLAREWRWNVYQVRDGSRYRLRPCGGCRRRLQRRWQARSCRHQRRCGYGLGSAGEWRWDVPGPEKLRRRDTTA